MNYIRFFLELLVFKIKSKLYSCLRSMFWLSYPYKKNVMYLHLFYVMHNFFLKMTCVKIKLHIVFLFTLYQCFHLQIITRKCDVNLFYEIRIYFFLELLVSRSSYILYSCVFIQENHIII